LGEKAGLKENAKVIDSREDACKKRGDIIDARNFKKKIR